MGCLNLLGVVFLVTAGASFQIGYLITVLNNPHKVFENFLNRTSGYTMPRAEMTSLWSFIVMSRGAGQLLGAFVACPLADSVGRKLSLLLVSLPLLLSLALQVSAQYFNSWQPLIAGRFIHGIVCGAIHVVAPVFLSEIAPVHYRGALTVMHHCLLGFGSLVGFFVGLPELLGTAELWPFLFFLPAIPAVLLILFLPFAAESPKFLLVSKENEEAALNSLLYYNGGDVKNAHETLQAIRRETVMGEQMHILSLCLTRPLRKSVQLTVIFGLLGSVAGPAIINSYSTKIMHEGGVPNNIAQYMSLGLGVVVVMADVCFVYLVEKAGRKVLIITGTWMILLAQAANFTLQTVHYHWPGSTAVIYGNAFFVFCWGIATLSMVGLYNAVVPELFPQQARSAGKSLELVCFYSVLLTLGTLFLPLLDLIGSYVYLFLLGPLALLALYLSFNMIETKDKEIADILQELNKEI